MDRPRRVHEAGAVVVRSMVVRLTHSPRRRGIEWCVVGGWGVDPHDGYELPEAHRRDVDLLRMLLAEPE